MYYGDYGNYEQRLIKPKDYDLRSFDTASKAVKASPAQVETPLFTFNRKVDTPSTDALGVYGKASFNMGQPKLSFAKELNVSNNDAAVIGRYVTPEQQARVSDNMLGYFG